EPHPQRHLVRSAVVFRNHSGNRSAMGRPTPAQGNRGVRAPARRFYSAVGRRAAPRVLSPAQSQFALASRLPYWALLPGWRPPDVGGFALAHSRVRRRSAAWRPRTEPVALARPFSSHPTTSPCTIEIKRGHFHAKVPVRTRDELGQLAASFNEM